MYDMCSTLYSNIIIILYTLWLFNIAMENDSSIDVFPIKTNIYSGFPMAMLVITRGFSIFFNMIIHRLSIY